MEIFMKKYFEVLQRCPLFWDIADKDIPVMLGCLGARIVGFKRKEIIIAEGEPPKDIGVVLSGAVQIVRVDYFGNRSIIAGIGPSEILGEAFACAGITSVPVDVTAAEDTEVMLINCRRITQSCGNACSFHQQMIYNLMKIMAKKNLVFHQKIEITSKRSTKEKLMAYLLMQAKLNKSNCFEIPYNRQELADYLEVERSGLSAEIGKLCRQGLIETDKKKFRILKSSVFY